MIKSNFGFFHDKNCQFEYGIKNSKKLLNKETKKRHIKEKHQHQQSDLKHQHKLTQQVFNKMRVLEELNRFKRLKIEPFCISCGKTKADWCCGHYKTVGSRSDLRYSRVNTYLQCNRYCNMALSGNISGTKITIGYKQGLINRMGHIVSNRLFNVLNRVKNNVYSGEYLINKRKEYNKKIKTLK